ncbi:hypothetical protein DPMN_091688 [Dreissena polymorpha]|uniref:Uncharacterized protein n=1 Tax=Dreissena polymorpha TaxID=45954 RepID=A0A9D4L0Y3_DREPO|nr:hypothetical protein DPMN_091688 [Dreissena polymorpha]
MVNSTTNTSAYITVNGEKLYLLVTSLKYFRATLSKDGTSTAKVWIRITLVTVAMARLNI